MNDKVDILMQIASLLTEGEKSAAADIINNNYPFVCQQTFSRSYTEKQKLDVFMRDGFIDRYTGKRLVNPGFLKLLSYYYPKEFPYQTHWKMTECHNAYWELCPTVDHKIPIARGGLDVFENWVTTSMLNNSVKSNWTLADLHWELHNPGNPNEWDGLTSYFVDLVEKDTELLSDKYIAKWYKVVCEYVKMMEQR